MKKALYQGAESIIYLSKDQIIKDRVSKSYRFSLLDTKIRKQRTKREANILKKAINIINVPKIISLEEYKINLEYIKGQKLSENLDKLKNANKICEEIGKSLAKLHDNKIIHGDLTTSNIISKKDRVYFLDFGLGYESEKIEDKASDLRLIKQALESKHFNNYKRFFDNIIKGYKLSKNYNKTISQLKKVESRGRYKSQY